MKRKNGLIKQGLSLCFLMKWEAPILDIMLEFFHTFVIKSTNIYFGYKDKVYVISKQLIVNFFGVYVKGYVKDPKGQVGKIVAL
jgi:hypothetical protein